MKRLTGSKVQSFSSKRPAFLYSLYSIFTYYIHLHLYKYPLLFLYTFSIFLIYLTSSSNPNVSLIAFCYGVVKLSKTSPWILMPSLTVCLFISLFIFHKVSTFFSFNESCQGRRYITSVLRLAQNRSIIGPVQPTAAETDIFGPV